MTWSKWIDAFNSALSPLSFSSPVTHVYNPLEYAREAHLDYLERFAAAPKQVVLLGMNPGPWGMAQTGVPFGEVNLIRDWLRIEGEIRKPPVEHPKRPVEGFQCKRSEVSGRRLWGWARETFATPERFAERFFVANYCPLSFMEAGGKNKTPNTLPAAEREPLMAVCDRYLGEMVERLRPEIVVGVGQFAAQRAAEALKGRPQRIGVITHPSPANPKANRGWVPLIEKELRAQGIAWD